jgi:hypothetical protein
MISVLSNKKRAAVGLAVAFLMTLSPKAFSEIADPNNTIVPDAVADPNIGFLQKIPVITSIERPDADEPQTITELINLFDSFAQDNRNADGTLNRGTHAKGKCFAGQVHIFSQNELVTQFHDSPQLAARLKRGAFAASKTVAANMRFANADGFGRIQPDTVADIRGFSFSMDSDLKDFAGTHKQDFMFNGAPVFITNGIKEFKALVTGAADLFIHNPNNSKIPSFDWTYLPDVLGDLLNPSSGNDNGKNTMSFAAQEYWTDLPYTHGMDATGKPLDIVKYKVAPCDGKGTQRLASVDGLAPDYLQKDIVERAKDGQVCLNLQIQFFDQAALRSHALSIEALQQSEGRSLAQIGWSTTDFVENGGALWAEDALPFQTVAQITIPQGGNHEINCDEQWINSRVHATTQNLPVGSISRVRVYVEEVSHFHRIQSIKEAH